MSNYPFPHVDAYYRAESIPGRIGNPFVEALPMLPDDKTLALTLTRRPEFDPAERQLSAPERVLRLDILKSFFVALPRHVNLARSIFKMVHTGYSKSRPFSPESNTTMQRLYELQQTGDFKSLMEPGTVAQLSMSLVAPPGCGKSSTLRHIAGLFPPVIRHESIGKWQTPFVFLEMPHDGESLHSLASSLFGELDRLYPTSGYFDLYAVKKGLNAERRMAQALLLAKAHGVGFICIDEAQNQKTSAAQRDGHSGRTTRDVSPKKETPLSKLLITASNISGIPLLFTGTLDMHDVLGKRASTSRRLAGNGAATWGVLDRNGEFETMMRLLWKYQWVRNPQPLTDAWVDLFFDFTQGIPDLLLKLFESSQVRAIVNKEETLTPEIVAATDDAEFVSTKLGVKGLRDKDEMLLSCLPDLYQADPIERAARSATQFLMPGRLTTGARPAARLPQRTARQRPTCPSPSPMQISVSPQSDLRRVSDTENACTVDLSAGGFPV